MHIAWYRAQRQKWKCTGCKLPFNERVVGVVVQVGAGVQVVLAHAQAGAARRCDVGAKIHIVCLMRIETPPGCVDSTIAPVESHTGASGKTEVDFASPVEFLGQAVSVGSLVGGALKTDRVFGGEFAAT